MTDAPTEPDTPITIRDQIEEVAKELRHRERLYPEWVKAGRYKGETANRKLAVMRRVQKTLEWLEANSAWIHDTYADRREAEHWARKEAMEHPDVALVREAFPGAEVVDVRKTESAA